MSFHKVYQTEHFLLSFRFKKLRDCLSLYTIWFIKKLDIRQLFLLLVHLKTYFNASSQIFTCNVKIKLFCAEKNVDNVNALILGIFRQKK